MNKHMNRRFSGSKHPVRGYTLRGRNGRIKYVGVTNNPGRRAAEHRKSGKAGKMKVEGTHRSRTSALKWERRRLANFRRNPAGKNPSMNKTKHGGWKY